MRLGIAAKINASIVFICIVLFGSYFALLLSQLYAEDVRGGERLAAQISEKKALEITHQLNETKLELESIAQTLLLMRANQAQDRTLAVEMLTSFLEKQSYLLGTYTLWEPNAFDNDDDNHRDTSGYHDESGRFIPYAVRTNDGIVFEPLRDYEEEAGPGYYLIPKQTKETTLVGPFYYEINGKDVLMTSLVVPILDKSGQFLGIVGADIELETLQSEFVQFEVFGGYASLLSEDGIYIANGRYPDKIMSRYEDVSENQTIMNRLTQASMFKVYTQDSESGERLLRLFYPVLIEGGSDHWFYEIVIPTDRLLGNFYKHLLQLVVVTAAVLSSMCLIIIWLVKRLVLNNIQQVIQTTKAIAAGDMTQRLSEHVEDEFGQMASYFNDMIRKRKEAEELASFHAEHDFLTGLPNRFSFFKTLQAEIDRNQGESFAVLFIDLDRFKWINDSKNHQIGDDVLQAVSQKIGEIIIQPDQFARFGGDEFLVLLKNVSDPESVHRKAEQILKAVSSPIHIAGKTLLLTASIGIRHFDDQHRVVSAEDMIKDADIAMYLAKKERNTYKIFHPEMSSLPTRESMIEEGLENAIDRGELMIYYQPKIWLSDMSIYGVEALLRWKHPTMGMIPPSEFIPIAESTGQIVPIGEWVLGQVCMQILDWEQAGIRDISIGVNLSIRQFQQKDFHEQIKATISKFHISSSLVDFELTESMCMSNPYSTVQSLQALKEFGSSVSLDDFGTGYSSLSYLKHLPLDVLKLDRSFIQEITSDDRELAIVRSVIDIAHSLKLKVVTEGVETIDQLHVLKLLKCDAAQGYVFYQPMPADECKDLLLSEMERGRGI